VITADLHGQAVDHQFCPGGNATGAGDEKRLLQQACFHPGQRSDAKVDAEHLLCALFQRNLLYLVN
jgi:hypothetical protein